MRIIFTAILTLALAGFGNAQTASTAAKADSQASRETVRRGHDRHGC